MSKNRIILILGVLVAILPLLGFPRLWESFFQVGIGLIIVLLSVWSSIDKHLTLKAKAQKRQAYKRREAEMAEPSTLSQEQQESFDQQISPERQP